MKSLIILSHEPYRAVMRQQYFMDEFEEEGYQVEFWCIQKVLRYSRRANYPNVETGKGVVYINSGKDLYDKLDRLNSGTLICLEIWFVWETFKLYLFLNKRRFYLFSIDYYKNNVLEVSRIQKVFRAAKNGRIQVFISYVKAFIKKITFQFYVKMCSLKGPSLVFVPGASSVRYGDHIVPINHFDLYQYEKEQQRSSPDLAPYLVFLDTCLTGHPDIQRQNRKTIDPELYFKKLNRFFDEVEAVTGCEVIIAGHPKCSYKNEFGSRACVINKTASLIIDSQGVIGHHSTSLNFAVLANKPIYLVYTEEFIKQVQPLLILLDVYDNMNGYQNKLNCSMLNIDRKWSLTDLKPVDEVAYKRFIDDFIVAPNNARENFNIIKNHLPTQMDVNEKQIL
jgi:hypothetical protein